MTYYRDFNDYQADTQQFVKSSIEGDLAYFTLGLAGEAGEVANKVKKLFRDDDDWRLLRMSIGGELGDIMWYMARIAEFFDLGLAEVASANVQKLEDRQRRGEIGGSGDNR